VIDSAASTRPAFLKAVERARRILEQCPELAQQPSTAKMGFGRISPQKGTILFVPAFDTMSPEMLAQWTRTRRGYDQVRAYVATTLRRRARLSPALSDFAADLVDGARLRRWRRESPLEFVIAIGIAVQDARKLVKTTFRNDESKREARSACDAVAEAATKVSGRRMTYGQVKERYKQFLRFVREVDQPRRTTRG
jgi:hypothetical protein